MLSEEGMPDVSIIVPVYNSSEYIVPCLESLCAQTMDDIEIILVDDHGTDDSMEKTRSFVSGYEGKKRFVFAQTASNSGPGAARNVGIDSAEGEYVAFVDSDDYVEPEFCRTLYELAKESDADMACCDIVIGERKMRNVDVNDKKYFLRHFVSYFTTFIYRKSLLDAAEIRFPEQSSAEDTCFLTCCVLMAGRVSQVHKPLYHYRINESSVSKKKNRSRAFARLKSVRDILRFAGSRGRSREYRKELLFLYLKKGCGMALKDLIFG